nr:2-amino-4-hydroxy-6-hydroxymethyldihydropteridine diphosphokinase [Corynebacterium lactis]
MIRAVLSIGANLGDARARLAEVFDYFRPETVAASRIYATAPWGGVEQGDFLNAVVIVETERTPMELLQAGWDLEQAAGRTREVKWGPRTLDVDIVQVIDLETGEEVLSEDPTLTLPHPWAGQRAFVLVPWLDADPDAVLRGVRVAALVGKLEPKDIAEVRAEDSGA